MNMVDNIYDEYIHCMYSINVYTEIKQKKYRWSQILSLWISELVAYWRERLALL